MTINAPVIAPPSTFETLDAQQLATATGGVSLPPVGNPLVHDLLEKGVGYVRRGWGFVKSHVKPRDLYL